MQRILSPAELAVVLSIKILRPVFHFKNLKIYFSFLDVSSYEGFNFGKIRLSSSGVFCFINVLSGKSGLKVEMFGFRGGQLIFIKSSLVEMI